MSQSRPAMCRIVTQAVGRLPKRLPIIADTANLQGQIVEPKAKIIRSQYSAWGPLFLTFCRYS